MPLRRRIGLLTALAVGITVLVAGVITYVVVRSELRGQVDDALTAQADLARDVARTPRGFSPPPGTASGGPPGTASGGPAVPLAPPSFGATTAIQIVRVSGPVGRFPTSQVVVPVNARDRAVAGGAAAFFSERDAEGTQLRVYTFSPGAGVAVQLARSLNGTNSVLERLRFVLVAALLLAVAAGGLLGRLFANRALQPIADLTDTVEHVELTGDLSPRIAIDEHGRRDEVGRLAGRFNAMLGRLQTSRAELDASVDAQRRLVADASHELRTPVTSMRTNAEVLRAQPDLPADQRGEILDDVVAQADELGLLVADLIALARDGEPPNAAEREDVRLDELVAEAVARTRLHAPGTRIDLETAPTIVEAHRERLGRAVNNLLDNAVKHGPSAGPVEVRVAAGSVTVRDHGPGIPAEDLEHVFDRFWRGADARARPGSGLGLAIVQQVAESHGGSVSVAAAPGGGALFELRLPVAG